MSDKVIFDQVIHAMFKGVLPRLSAEGLERIKASGIDPTKKLLPAYPATVWASCVRVLSAELHPGLEAQEAARRLARGTVDVFADELLGRAMFGLLKLLGADRVARRMTQNFRTGSNFVDTRLTRINETPLTNELWINDVSGLPGFYLGLLEGGLHHTSSEPYDIRLIRSDGCEAVYHLARVERGP